MNQTLSIFIQISMWIAVLLSFIVLVPGVVNIIKTRNTMGVSKWMYILYPICSAVWITYAILLIFQHDIPIGELVGMIVSDTISVGLSLWILFMKLRNVSLAKKQHMTEYEWYKAYVKQKKEKERLKALGIHSTADLVNSKQHQDYMSKIIDSLAVEHPSIVDDRITSSREYRKMTNKSINTAQKRIEHYKNVASNADMAKTISLVYLDLYQGRDAKRQSS
ncbi:MAG: hypothetical protein LBG49_00845 [Mycoplasmataceae bacterium]|nr:hypothetical protein [Mycoplasmataceae bacterium]